MRLEEYLKNMDTEITYEKKNFVYKTRGYGLLLKKQNDIDMSLEQFMEKNKYLGTEAGKVYSYRNYSNKSDTSIKINY